MIRPGSSLARKPKKASTGPAGPMAKAQPAQEQQEELKLETFIEKHDYTGAITLLEFERKISKQRPDGMMWLAYCYVHNGQYDKASVIYSDLIQQQELSGKPDTKKIEELWLYKACCSYGLCEYQQASEEAAKSGTSNPLQNRLMFHVAWKLDDEPKIVERLQKMRHPGRIEDSLCVAALQYLRLRFGEAIEEYKQLLEKNLDMLALHVYVALSYYKLDYHELADDILNEYIEKFPGSLTAVNLKACCLFHLQEKGGAAAAEQVLLDLERRATAANTVSGAASVIQNNDLLRHNLAVFKGCPNAEQVLEPLKDILPEARHNLAIHYLKVGDYKQAYELVKDSAPVIAPEYVLKGVACMAQGQATNSKQLIQDAHELFKTVGMSPTAKDTIQGRQSMAACFFLNKQFSEVLVYMRSIKDYFPEDDTFLWNFGIALAGNHEYAEAAEQFLQIQNPVWKRDPVLVGWTMRSLIRASRPDDAWSTLDAAMRPDEQSRVPEMDLTDVFTVLTKMADDYYKMGQFIWAFRAFDQLESLQRQHNGGAVDESSSDYFEAKRGAAVGVFQLVVAGEADHTELNEVMGFLAASRNPQCEYILKTVRTWCSKNGVHLEY